MRILVVAVLLLLWCGPAFAHEGRAGLDNVLDSVTPSLPGVTIQVVSSVVDEVVVDNPTAMTLTVLAPTGEPFLQIGSQGVLANLNSPTWVASNTPGGVTDQPAVGPPRWAQVSAGTSWGWFDPRLPGQGVAPPAGARPGVPITVAPWAIPMRYGGRAVSVAGHLQYQPPTGAVVARLVTPPPVASGLTLAVLPGGAAPGLFASWSGGSPVTVLGQGGEPFVRFSDRGAEANLASPTWALAAQAAGAFVAASSGRAPEWRLMSSAPRLSWLEPRALYAPGTPPPDVQDRTSPTDLTRWTLPISFAGRIASVAGVTQWVPDASSASASRRVLALQAGASHRFNPLFAVVAALLLVGAGAGVVSVRRRPAPG